MFFSHFGRVGNVSEKYITFRRIIIPLVIFNTDNDKKFMT